MTSSHPRSAPACAAAAALAAVLWAAAGPAPPAAAHPFGPPSTATISADGPRVSIAWHAAEDDWVALGQALGALEDPATGTVSTELTGEQKLQRSEEVRGYLLDQIYVTQDGTRCAGEVTSMDDLLTEGARLSYRCPRDVQEVDVTVGALSDLNEAYRTVLTAETAADPRSALLTATETTQRMNFSWYAGVLSTPGFGVAAGTAAAIVAGAVAWVLRGRRRAGKARS
ncbi:MULTISPECIES: hypothetical protein [Streptomyces]|uniref:Uncharacterized protein n=1 Tax=Streptomyces cheonanensis TaxID=312720 RepID=A0ABP5GB54_9ACTN|nr:MULTISPECIES: hypothetical protein [Streptomyces]QKV68450.1 hypothetical protein HUT13_06350 [Streptomyces harbinensis]